jgi:hypothetical protein
LYNNVVEIFNKRSEHHELLVRIHFPSYIPSDITPCVFTNIGKYEKTNVICTPCTYAHL